MAWHVRGSRVRPHVVALGAALVLMGGVACSAAGSFVEKSQSASSGVDQKAPRPPAIAPASGAAVSAAVAPGAPAPAAARAAAQPQQDATTSATNTIADSSAQILDRMVIRTAQLTVEVLDIDGALAQARAIATRGGGYVSASNTHFEKVNDQDRMVADLTLQVRSDAADSTMSDLRALGKVTAETSGSQDVTDEYVDLDSNLRNLQASEAAILKLMDKATQIQDVLQLQRELTNVRGQIERIQGRKQYLERRTDMATITLALRLPPVAATTTTVGGAWDPVAIASRGWQASLTVLRGMAEVVIVVLAFSWWLVPVAAVGAYVWIHRRRPTPAPVATETA